ncbi:unnamed protein product [Bemisia tabaci]|uniref:Uncharacterized protein n=1 Tax=Bemisia tabaci TaxID=7038 RepID=A0A9P0APC1_BEMTA|nr:unnamed protein product [Bemisia tabaci]
MSVDIFPRYGSDLPVPAKTERRFIYANEKEEQKLLLIIYEHHLQFRQDWPIEVRRTQDHVIVYIDNIEAFSYFGAPRLSKPIIECYKRDGDFAIIESGLRRHRAWSFLWFRLPLRHLPEAKIQLKPVPDPSIPWKSIGCVDEYLGPRSDRLISTPSGLQIRDSNSDYLDFHTCPLRR